MRSEEGKQFLHAFEVRGVDDEAPGLTRMHEAGVREFLQVEGQGGRHNVEGLGNFTGSKAGRTRLHEEAERLQASGLGEGGKGHDGVVDFHVSRLVETWKWEQAPVSGL